MSLFEDPRYQWRETYFVLFPRSRRPDHVATEKLLKKLAHHYTLGDQRLDDQGRIESFTLVSPEDCAAMDISYLAGEDVTEQVAEFIRDLSGQPIEPTEQRRLDELKPCDARFEVFHFERCDMEAADEDEAAELLDPTTLFDVIRKLSRACGGIGIDPQAGTFVG